MKQINIASPSVSAIQAARVALLGAAILTGAGISRAQAGSPKLPPGVLLYWNADNAGQGWRDAEWQKGGSGRIHYDREIKRYGSASVRLDGVPEKEVHISSVCSPVEIDAAQPLVLRFWARRTGDKGNAFVQVLAHARTDAAHSRPIGWVAIRGKDRFPIPLTPEWKLFDLRLSNFPGGAGRLFFYFRVKGPTILWVDEVSLARPGVTVPVGGHVELADADFAGVRFDDARLPENLLKNPGFEQGLKAWQTMGGGSAAAVDTTRAAGGKASLRFDAKEFTSGGVWQRVRVDPRRQYRLSLKAQCRGLVGYGFTKVLRFNRHRQPMGWVGDEILVTGTTDGWGRYATTFQPTPDTDSIVVYLRVEDTVGKVWMDDVVLRPLPR